MATDAVGDDGRVVRELDVYLCAGNVPEATKLTLLQYPLRPHWRPYNIQDTDKVKLKPKARKLQMHLGGQQGPGSGVPARPLLLQSTGADMGASYAVGVVRGGRLLLAPLDQVMQLRPSLAHLDRGSSDRALTGSEAVAADERVSGAGPALDAMDEDDANGTEMEPVRVNVLRRETERQVEMRQRSYAWQQKEEEAEPWTELRRRGADSAEAAALWDAVTAVAAGGEVPMTLGRQQYLDLLVPGVSEDDFRDRNLEVVAEPRAKVDGPAAPLGLPQQNLGGDAAAEPGRQRTVSAEAWRALPAAVDALLRTKQAVVNLDAVRSWLRTNTSAGEAEQAAHAADADLHAGVLRAGGVVHIRGRYILAELGDAKHDPFRKLVLQLLEVKKEALKRSDILDFVKTAGLEGVADAVYSRVMKELCFSRSAQWNLKSGEPWEV